MIVLALVVVLAVGLLVRLVEASSRLGRILGDVPPADLDLPAPRAPYRAGSAAPFPLR